MRLASVSVENFRSIRKCEIKLPDFTSLIGPNNSGKSTILRAIEIFLNQIKPELDDWHKVDKVKSIEKPIIIEGIFLDIQSWERNVSGIAGIVYNNQVRLRLVAERKSDDKSGEEKVHIKYEAFSKEEHITGWEKNWGQLSPEIKKIAAEAGIDGTKWRNEANKETVKQHIRDNYPEMIQLGDEKWSSEHISIDAALKQALPKAVLIPAVKDATDDTKPTARSSFGLLLSQVIVPAIEASTEFTNLKQAVNALSARIRGEDDQQLEQVKELMEELSHRMSSIIEAQVIVNLEPPDTNKFLGSSTSIRLDDGIETPISMQGHGVQRSLVFALLEVLAKREAQILKEDGTPPQQRSTVLLFEEPELYMHPHLMRRLKNALKSISNSDNWQVILSTHSPFLLDVASDPTSLIIMRKDEECRTNKGNQLKKDPFLAGLEYDERSALRAALDFHPTVAEAFFAERVVLVEGDTEMAVFRHHDQLLELTGIDKRKSDLTTIVSCGGKWTIPAMARLLASFGVPFRILHDCDRKELSDEELASTRSLHPFRANKCISEAANGAAIYVVDDCFEHLLWNDISSIPASSGSGKPYNAWCRIKELCDGYKNMDHAPKLREVVQFAFNW
ncbi:MAG: hypothetical protein CL610_20710 [Anaerolineaceae bacterium]|nr:hypothetical protein [Anaerolineaceae bacterium]